MANNIKVISFTVDEKKFPKLSINFKVEIDCSNLPIGYQPPSSQTSPTPLKDLTVRQLQKLENMHRLALQSVGNQRSSDYHKRRLLEIDEEIGWRLDDEVKRAVEQLEDECLEE